MAIKSIELVSGCIAKAADDEPVFVLRGQDALAGDTVRDWARRALEAGCPEAKYFEAIELADKMDAWPNRKLPD